MDCTPESKKEKTVARDTWACMPDIIETVLSFCDVMDCCKTARVSKTCAQFVKALPDSYFHQWADRIVKEDGNPMFQAMQPVIQHVKGRAWRQWVQGCGLRRCRVKGCSHLVFAHAMMQIYGINDALLVQPARDLLQLPVVCTPCSSQLLYWTQHCQATDALIKTLEVAKLRFIKVQVNLVNPDLKQWHYIFIRAEAKAVLDADKSWPRALRDLYNL